MKIELSQEELSVILDLVFGRSNGVSREDKATLAGIVDRSELRAKQLEALDAKTPPKA